MTGNVHTQQLLPEQEAIMPTVKSSQLVCQNVIVDKVKHGELSVFVEKLKKDLLKEKTATITECEASILESGRFVPADDSEILQSELLEATSKLNDQQRNLFEKITSTMLQKEQMVGFISGEGGVGKSLIISLIRKWCSYIYGKTRNNSCAVCAFTGPAAYSVRGETWHSMFCKKKTC